MSILRCCCTLFPAFAGVKDRGGGPGRAGAGLLYGRSVRRVGGEGEQGTGQDVSASTKQQVSTKLPVRRSKWRTTSSSSSSAQRKSALRVRIAHSLRLCNTVYIRKRCGPCRCCWLGWCSWCRCFGWGSWCRCNSKSEQGSRNVNGGVP